MRASKATPSSAKKERGKMRQKDPLTQAALRNYETFYSLAPGTADYRVVDASSAGIQGWAKCSIEQMFVLG